jgi:hypothetical protein
VLGMGFSMSSFSPLMLLLEGKGKLCFVEESAKLYIAVSGPTS